MGRMEGEIQKAQICRVLLINGNCSRDAFIRVCSGYISVGLGKLVMDINIQTRTLSFNDIKVTIEVFL